MVCVAPGTKRNQAVTATSALAGPAIPKGATFFPSATCVAAMPSGPHPIPAGPPGFTFNCHIDG